MLDGTIWIDACEVEVKGAVAFVTSTSGKKSYTSCMSRSGMREYLERAIRTLNAADEHERCQIIPILGDRPPNYLERCG